MSMVTFVNVTSSFSFLYSRPAVMSSASVKVTSLPIEVLHRAAVDLSQADICRLSETNRLFARVTRRMRLRVFVMSPRSFTALEKWVHIGSLWPKHCVCPGVLSSTDKFSALMFCRKSVLSYRNGRCSHHHSNLPYVDYFWYALC